MIPIFLAILVIVMWTASATNDLKRRNVPAKSGASMRRRSLLRSYAAAIVIVVLLGPLLLAPEPGGMRYPQQSRAMQTTRTLVLAMFQYSMDNNDQYPDGASSTEVFQTLMDGNYLTDPSILFVALPGKVRAKPGAKLKPENIAYDVTSGVDAHSPDNLPVVYLTGFRMTYRADAPVVSLVKPFPSIAVGWDWWWSAPSDRDDSLTTFEGLPVGYKSNNAYFRSQAFSGGNLGGYPTPQNRQYTPDGYGIVTDVIDSSFDAQGRTYRQLTPEGVLK
jgi:hypothetical protein